MTALYIHKPERVYGSNLQVPACTPKKSIENPGNILKKTRYAGENE
jgi:hypothetical protein